MIIKNIPVNSQVNLLELANVSNKKRIAARICLLNINLHDGTIIDISRDRGSLGHYTKIMPGNILLSRTMDPGISGTIVVDTAEAFFACLEPGVVSIDLEVRFI